MIQNNDYEYYYFEEKFFMIPYKDFLNKIIFFCNKFNEKSAGVIKLDENHFAKIFLQRMPDDIDWSYQLLFNVIEGNQSDCFRNKDKPVYSSMLTGSNDFNFLNVQLLSDMIQKVIAGYKLIENNFTIEEHIFNKNTDFFKLKNQRSDFCEEKRR